METGASVPGYSGGLAAAQSFRIRGLKEGRARQCFIFFRLHFCLFSLLSAFCFHPALPYAVFLRNTLILSDDVPRAMP